MKRHFAAVIHLSDEALIEEVKGMAGREREVTARLIALVAELDARRLYLGQGCSSLFSYCTQVLRLSEHAAYGRIEAARAARKFPVVLDLVADGAVTLTTITLLAPHLTPVNHLEVLEQARHQTKRQVEHIVARLRPLPDAPALIRKMPARPAAAAGLSPSSVGSADPTSQSVLSLLGDDESSATPVFPSPAPTAAALLRPATVTPLAPERYKVQLTVSRETNDKLRRAQDLLRHSIANGDLAIIIDRALTLLLADLERTKFAATDRPRSSSRPPSSSRHIPGAVRRAVWKRDAGQCAFVGPEGRCMERGFLEFHHVEPHAVGGPPAFENVEVRCRAHNLHEAEQYFGSRWPLLVREGGARVRDADVGMRIVSCGLRTPGADDLLPRQLNDRLGSLRQLVRHLAEWRGSKPSVDEEPECGTL
jgi:hypothetical protein